MVKQMCTSALLLLGEVQKPKPNWLLNILVIVLALALIAVIFLLVSNRLAKQKRVKLGPRDMGDDVPTRPSVAPSGYTPAVHSGIRIGNDQDPGARRDQQDAFGIKETQYGLLAVLADGMGGLSNGAAYSNLAKDTALKSFLEEGLEKTDEATLLRILRRSRDAITTAGLQDGGTTFIAALIRSQQLHFISVGDSRISLMRNGGLIQLNREHVYGRELDDLAANGFLSREEAEGDRQRAAITSYIGKKDELLIDRNIAGIPLFSGDKVVLMSDGVYGYLPEEELTQCLRKEPRQAAAAVKQAILNRANPRQDNLTIIVLEIE